MAPAPLFQAVSADYGHVGTWFERLSLVAELTGRRGSPGDAVDMAKGVRFDGDVPTLPPRGVSDIEHLSVLAGASEECGRIFA